MVDTVLTLPNMALYNVHHKVIKLQTNDYSHPMKLLTHNSIADILTLNKYSIKLIHY